MKLIDNVTLEKLQKYQTENMDPALDILNIKLNKFEKRKQVASRLLGFSSFESIKFDTESYSQAPDIDQVLIARHPKLKNIIVVLAKAFAVCISENSGDAYFIEQANLYFSDITERLFQEAGSHHFEFELNFEPKEIELGFSGVKTLDVSLWRVNGLRLELDWKMRNGLIIPLAFKMDRKLVERPISDMLNVSLSIDISAGVGKHEPARHILESSIKYQGDAFIGNLTDEMLLWEVQQSTNANHWKNESALMLESFDCVRIAYAFLSAQKTTKNKRRIADAELKTCIEKWGGRYVSKGDVELAIKLHPEIVGDLLHCNLSERLVMPCGERLIGIQEAKTQDYLFYAEDGELDLFKYIEKRDFLKPFDKKLFIELQDGVALEDGKTLSFYEWLMEQADRDTPIGDFSIDAKEDSSFPKNANSYDVIVSYMYKQISGFEAVEAFETVWKEYLAYQGKNT